MRNVARRCGDGDGDLPLIIESPCRGREAISVEGKQGLIRPMSEGALSTKGFKVNAHPHEAGRRDCGGW